MAPSEAAFSPVHIQMHSTVALLHSAAQWHKFGNPFASRSGGNGGTFIIFTTLEERIIKLTRNFRSTGREVLASPAASESALGLP